MMEFLTQGWILELGWIVAKIMVVIGPLLIAVAYLTLAERRVIGFMQLAQRAECGWPVWSVPAFCRCAKADGERNHHASGCEQGVFHDRADADLYSGTGRMGGDSVWRRIW